MSQRKGSERPIVVHRFRQLITQSRLPRTSVGSVIRIVHVAFTFPLRDIGGRQIISKIKSHVLFATKYILSLALTKIVFVFARLSSAKMVHNYDSLS
jgi:hypothetical protein